MWKQRGAGLSCALHSSPIPHHLGPFSLHCPLCLFQLYTSGQPMWSLWTPWSDCSASCGPAQHHRHCFCTGPPGRAQSSVALLPLSASAPPLCRGPEVEEEPCLLLECDCASHEAQTSLLPCPSQAQPLATASSSIAQELEAGALGDSSPAVAGPVEGRGSPELDLSL